jgi:hypothetical protein
MIKSLNCSGIVSRIDQGKALLVRGYGIVCIGTDRADGKRANPTRTNIRVIAIGDLMSTGLYRVWMPDKGFFASAKRDLSGGQGPVS